MKGISLDENDIVRPSARKSVLNRWSSTSSLQTGSAERHMEVIDEAIYSARQKPILQRIAEMKLETEERVTCRDISLTTSDSEVANNNEDCSGDIATAMSETTVPQVVVVSEDCAAQLNQDMSLVIMSDTCSSHSDTPPTPTSPDDSKSDVEEATNKATTTELETVVAGEHSARPASLYPSDLLQLLPADEHLDDSSPPAQTDDISSHSASETVPADDASSLDAEEQTVSCNTTHVAASSRKSYVALTQFFGEKFSFLDDLDEVKRLSGNVQTVFDETCNSCSADIADETDNSAENKSDVKGTADPSGKINSGRSIIRKSIILPNGEILEVIGDAFTFLDDYES